MPWEGRRVELGELCQPAGYPQSWWLLRLSWLLSLDSSSFSLRAAIIFLCCFWL